MEQIDSTKGCPSVVIVNVGSEDHALVDAIFAREKPENVVVNDPKSNSCVWRLVTKYFRADLRLVEVPVTTEELLALDAADFL